MNAEASEKLHDELAYLAGFGLKVNPFPVAPDVEHFFLSRSIDRVVTEIVHGTLTRKGFMVLTGEVGLGKTTISRKVMKILEEKGVQTSLVFHTSYQDVELLREINRDFDLPAESVSFDDQMKLLRDFLLDQNRQGTNCAILIDDAQNLNNSSLELVRMISNLEIDQEKLVQILLVGQPELLDKLESPELRQLKSRIIISGEARPLTEDELRNYILFKLNAAGSIGKIGVDEKAFKRIHGLTGGNLRQVNKLMDRCLYVAFLNNTNEISLPVLEEARMDLVPMSSRKRPGGAKGTFIRFVMPGILFFVVLAFFYPSRGFRQDRPGNMLDLAQVHKGTEKKGRRDSPVYPASGTENPRATAGMLPEQSVRKTSMDKPPASVAVMDFLGAYGLKRFASAFNNAMMNHDYERISEEIYRKTGYRLIRLTSLTERIKQKYGILVSPSGEGNKNFFHLFWHPGLLVNRFYYGYTGKEIMELQRLLAGVRLYRGSIDGIVGKGLMKAVIRFQKKRQIEVSGYPDEQTLFLLHEASPRMGS